MLKQRTPAAPSALRNDTPEDYGRWGDVFEITTKIGVLNCLAGEFPLDVKRFQHLACWQRQRKAQVLQHLCEALRVTDGTQRDQIKHLCDHLFVVGYGLGFTVMRTWLDNLRLTYGNKSDKYKAEERIDSVWCPLSLPSRESESKEEVEARRELLLRDFWQAMVGDPPVDSVWNRRGEPANADFLMCFSDGKGQSHLLCLEFSLNVPPELPDLQKELSHLRELSRSISLIERRGVFSHVRSEVSGENFIIGDDIVRYIGALTTKDKPLWKLCQGASYATRFASRMTQRQQLQGSLQAHVIAITAAGVEAISAPLGSDEAIENPRSQLMRTLGSVYRNKFHDLDDDEAFEKARQELFGRLNLALPGPLRREFKALSDRKTLKELLDSERFQIRLQESIEDFVNPTTLFPREDALQWLHARDHDQQQELDAFFGGPAREAVEAQLPPDCNHLTLRDIHGAAICAGIQAAPVGKLTVLGLEGHPGIGKTFSTIKALKQMSEGFLFFYASPRIVINNDVMDKFEYDCTANPQPNDVIAITTNSVINRGASSWYAKNRAKYRYNDIKSVRGGVICHKPSDFEYPKSERLYLSQDVANTIERDENDSGYVSRVLDSDTNQIHQQNPPGVMRTLAHACRDALRVNERINRVVLTGAIQGYREPDATQNTIDAFGKKLFENESPSTTEGLGERREFAQRIPTIIVMIDELAGDGAGPALVHAFARMLKEQFIRPFQGEVSPFRVVLILADASLGNQIVLTSFLSSGDQAPPKVLLSPGRRPQDSKRSQPFEMCAQELYAKHGKSRLRAPALHIMADAFPAASLDIDYALYLTPLKPLSLSDLLKKAHVIVKEQQESKVLCIAASEILSALRDLDECQQVIFFAQNKHFLRELETTLLNDIHLREIGLLHEGETPLSADDIAKLDSSVSPSVRRSLLQPESRDKKRVILMTSSGARGISFPHATRIIAQVPTFSVESGLMEIAQLIFRGRGTGGDNHNRRLVMILHDYVFPEADGKISSRTWTRHLVDLVTMVVMLRATILTRITGDAGLRHQSLSLIPIGGVGVDQLLQTMSHAVSSFLHEAQMFTYDSSSAKEPAGLVKKAHDDVLSLFRKSRWDGIFEKNNLELSATRFDEFQRFLERVTRDNSPMVRFQQPVTLPGTLHCDGMVWYEDWTNAETQEYFTFDLWHSALRQHAESLLNKLIHIKHRQNNFPPSLKRAARDLFAILNRDKERRSNTQASVKSVDSRDVWVLMPVDYPRFVQSNAQNLATGRPWRLEFPKRWHPILKRVASTSCQPQGHHPVLPEYRDSPYLGIVTHLDPIGLKLAFDSRYFLASRELNLLSTMLLSDINTLL